jgi:hypothetical protein
MWLSVIGKALAFLCLNQAIAKDPEKYKGLLKQVKFLQGLGLSRDDAAHTAGSSPASVQVRTSQLKGRARNVTTKKAKKKKRR